MTTQFCAANEGLIDAKDCICAAHYWAWLEQPESQAGLEKAKQIKRCEYHAEDGTRCPVTDGLVFIVGGASDDDGDEVFFVACPDHKWEFM